MSPSRARISARNVTIPNTRSPASHRLLLSRPLSRQRVPVAETSHKTLGTGLRQGPRGVRFLVGEVLLYALNPKPGSLMPEV